MRFSSSTTKILITYQLNARPVSPEPGILTRRRRDAEENAENPGVFFSRRLPPRLRASASSFHHSDTISPELSLPVMEFYTMRRLIFQAIPHLCLSLAAAGLLATSPLHAGVVTVYSNFS